MSLLDEVRKLEEDLVSRLRELEPLMREYEQLRELAERLGVEYSPESESANERVQAQPAARRPRGAAKKRTAGKRRAATKPRTTGRTARAKPRTGDDSARRGGARKRRAARPGQRIDDVLRVVTANPGISVREVGAQLGVDATGLYRVANKLTEDGRVRKDGTKLYAVESGGAAPAGKAADARASGSDTGAAASTTSSP